MAPFKANIYTHLRQVAFYCLSNRENAALLRVNNLFTVAELHNDLKRRLLVVDSHYLTEQPFTSILHTRKKTETKVLWRDIMRHF